MRFLRLGIGTGLLIALSSLSWAAQSGSTINGPSLGFVTNENGTAIWPLLGILGASVPGPALVLPESIVHAAISPQQDYALALAGERAEPVIVYLDASNPGVVPLAGGRPSASLIAISPTGTAAALYQRESKFLQLVSGLPANPQIGYEFDASNLGGNIRDIAVSDDAKLALVTVGDESRTLWVIDAKGIVTPVVAGQPSRIAFIAKRPDALIADDASREVFVLQGLDLNPVRLPGIVLREDARPISAVTASSDGQSIFVAQQDSEDITITDVAARTTTVVSCHCKPTVFSPLKGASLFRLNGLSNGPMMVLDASTSNPRTVIIPLDPNVFAGKGNEAP